MLKETKNEETRLFCHILLSVAFRLGGEGAGYAYDCNFNAICDIKILCAFLPLRACPSHANGSILYDHAKYVILLVKVEIVLNSSRNLKL